jgi:hypothetical protein
MRGEMQMVVELWQDEKGQLLPLPTRDYPACATRNESQPLQPGGC